MGVEDEKVLTPQVQWAQRKHMIILRVLVKPLEVCMQLQAAGPHLFLFFPFRAQTSQSGRITCHLKVRMVLYLD